MSILTSGVSPATFSVLSEALPRDPSASTFSAKIEKPILLASIDSLMQRIRGEAAKNDNGKVSELRLGTGSVTSDGTIWVNAGDGQQISLAALLKKVTDENLIGSQSSTGKAFVNIASGRLPSSLGDVSEPMYDYVKQLEQKYPELDIRIFNMFKLPFLK